MLYIYAKYANYFMGIFETTISVYTSYEPNAINNVTRSTGKHTFHINSIYP